MLKIRNRALFISIFILLLCVDKTQAQESNTLTLQRSLELLEEEFDVRFSYAAEDIEAIMVSFQMEDTLQTNIDQLSAQIPFRFNKINERYITLVKLDSIVLCGRIMNAITGEPLEDATVSSVDNTFNTVTDAQGVFFVKDIGYSVVIIRHLGFDTIQLEISELTENCTPILLEPVYSDLDAIVVRNYLIRGLSKELDGSVSINTDGFGLLPGQVENDILQITSALPGIQSVNETISNINIRSGTHDENLILWDNIRMYQSGHFFGLISAFNPDITKNVKVHKNGTPAEFGEGVSGVIAMYSDDVIADNFGGGIGINLINGSAFANVPVSDNASIQVSGRHSINSLWETPVYTNYSEKIFQDTEITNNDSENNGLNIDSDEDFKFYDFSTKFLWNPGDKDKIRINLLAIDNELTFREVIPETERSQTSLLEQRSLVGGLSWTHSWSESLSTESLVYATYYDLDALNRDLLTTQETFQENEVLETGVKLLSHWKLSNQIELHQGYQFNETGISNTQDVNLPRFRDFNKEVLRTHSVFTSFEFKSENRNTHLIAGARASYFEKFDKYLIEPRISAHQSLGSGFAVELQGEFKSQTTTQRIDFESDFLGVEKRRWILANDQNIPISESKQVSLGFLYDRNSWFINIEGFLKEVGGITSSNQGFQNQFQFERSIGSYDASGLELVINKRTKNFSGWISYTYLNSVYTFDAFEPSSFPHNLNIEHNANIAASYSINDFKVALGVNWHSGKPFTVPTSEDEIVGGLFSETIQFDLPNNQRLPDYFRTDISLEYLWSISDSSDLKVNAAVLNVLDSKNTLNVRYALVNDSEGNTRLNKIEAFSLGITPNIALQFLF